MTWTVKNGDFQLKMPLSHTVVRNLIGVVRSHFFADPFFPPPPPLLPCSPLRSVHCNIVLRFWDRNQREAFENGRRKWSWHVSVSLYFSMIEQYSWGHPALLASPTARTRLHSCRWTVEDYSVRVVETAEGFRKGSRWPEETSHSKLKSVSSRTSSPGSSPSLKSKMATETIGGCGVVV